MLSPQNANGVYTLNTFRNPLKETEKANKTISGGSKSFY